jgi:hypothetical protein
VDILQIALVVAAFLCSLVAGFLFAFAVVAMLGFKSLSDREYGGCSHTWHRSIGSSWASTLWMRRHDRKLVNASNRVGIAGT